MYQIPIFYKNLIQLNQDMVYKNIKINGNW